MNIENQKQILLARRNEITKHLNEVEDQLDDTPPADWEDRASERQGDEVLEALGNTEAAEIKQIDAALGRIEAGTYGVCAKCGEAISDERLALLPATPLCKNCMT